MFILHFGNTYFPLFLTFIHFEDICFVLPSGDTSICEDISISHSIVGTYVYRSLHREVLNIVQHEGHKHCTLWEHIIGDQFS